MAGFTYKSYSFIDKDPILDEIRTIISDSGASYKYIEYESGVTTATLYNWFGGKTKRPQAASINAVLRSLGYKLAPVPFGVPVKFIPPLPIAKPASARHIVQMAKYKKGSR